MNELRTKAQEVKQQGMLERGEFNPTGAPLKLYKYWSSRAHEVPTQENFCHFWRVVAIWAPLMFVGVQLSRVLDNTIFRVIALIVAVITIGWLTTSVNMAFGLFLLIPYAIFGFSVGIAAGTTFNGWNDFKTNDLDYGRFAYWTSIITAPLSLPLFFLIQACRKVSPRTWRKIGERLLIGLIAFAGLSLTFVLALAIIKEGWVVLALIALALVGMGAIVALVSLAEFLVRRRRTKKFYAYVDSLGSDDFDPDELATIQESGRIKAFFSGVGDFLILVFNVIRVNKWKICPLVKVD